MEQEHEWEWWFVAAGFFLLGTIWGWGVASLSLLRDAPLYITFGAASVALVLVGMRMLKRPSDRGVHRHLPH